MNRTIVLSIICLVGCDIRTEPGTGTESGNPPVIEKPTPGTPSAIILPAVGEPDVSSGTPAPCEDDEECIQLSEEQHIKEGYVEWGKPTDYYSTYESSYCIRAKKGSNDEFIFTQDEGESSCLCIDEDPPSYIEGERGDLLTPLVDSDCLIKGRFNACLYYKDEFTGCDLHKPIEGCESICEDLEQRIVQDAMWNTEIVPRLAKCLSPTKGEIGSCHIIGEIDGDCYAFFGAFFGNVNEPLDCSLTDEELVSEIEDDLSYGVDWNTQLRITWSDSDEVEEEEYAGSQP